MDQHWHWVLNRQRRDGPPRSEAEGLKMLQRLAGDPLAWVCIQRGYKPPLRILVGSARKTFLDLAKGLAFLEKLVTQEKDMPHSVSLSLLSQCFMESFINKLETI